MLLENITLRELVGDPPPRTPERIAWCMHVAGYLVRRPKRVTQFGMCFLEDYEDLVKSLPEDRNVWVCAALLVRHAAWTLKSAWDCFWHRDSGSGDASPMTSQAINVNNIFIITDQQDVNNLDIPLSAIRSDEDCDPDDRWDDPNDHSDDQSMGTERDV